MKVVKRILLVMLILIVVMALLTFVDYHIVRHYNKVPRIALKKEDKDNQIIEYSAMFYKVWYCTADETIIIGNKYDGKVTCPRKVEFNDGYYVNSKKINMSQKDYIIMSYKNMFPYEYINNIKSSDEIEKSASMAYEYIKTLYEEVEEVNDNKIVSFYDYILSNKEYKIGLDTSKKYCLKEDVENNTIAYSLYENDTCSNDYKELKLSQEWCKFYKDSILLSTLEIEKNICK